MKIAMIGLKGIPAYGGGVEKHVEELATLLVQQGHDVTVYCRNTYSKEKMDTYQGITIKVIKTIPNKNLDAIVYTYRATKDALKSDFDIFHYHALGPASLSIIPILRRKKVVVTVHGLDWKRDKWSKFGKMYLKFGEFITGKTASKIISVSLNLKDYFIEKYHRLEEDVSFIPNGVRISEKIPPKEINKFGLVKDNYILFLARLVPEKGAHYLIKAYNEIITNKKLVIAGGSSFSDDYLKELKQLAGNNENIIFTGNVQGAIKEELYSNCSLYVLPSDIEGMPITLLEAMSYGKNCLVSNIPENCGVTLNGSYGNEFIQSDVSNLSEMLNVTLNCEYNEENSLKIMSYIKENFEWQNIAIKTVEVYKSVLKQN